MGRQNFPTIIIIASTLVMALNSCSQIGQLTRGTTPASTGNQSANPQPDGSGSGQQTDASQVPVNPPNTNEPPLTGDWQVAFQVGNKTFHANMHLQQQGMGFTGTGNDDPTNREFAIEEGAIDQGSVHFFKRYPGVDPAAAPPVEYTGKIENVTDGPADQQGLWLSGEYATTFQGNPLRGNWEAHMPMDPSAEQPAQTNTNAPETPRQAVDPNKAPHLSGKWQVGYEFNFKTIKSTMYLEQDGGKITGHGEDKNTKEKFVIEKGWYNFPRVTLVRKYIKGKGAASDRTMTFKAQVSNINDPDYQGPYLKGKTEGGGDWEGQLYK